MTTGKALYKLLKMSKIQGGGIYRVRNLRSDDVVVVRC